jgi:hypothetical protein
LIILHFKKGLLPIIVTSFSLLFISACGTNTSSAQSTNEQNKNKGEEQMSEQEIAEQYAEKMKPEIKQALRDDDVNSFIESINFEDDIEINPMGYIIVRGYVNDHPEKYDFSAHLRLNSNEIDVLGTSPKLSEKFIDKEKEQRLLKEAEEEEKQVQ